MKKEFSSVLFLGAALGAFALAACGDDSSSGPTNSDEPGASSASNLSGTSGDGGSSGGASSGSGEVVVNPDDSTLVVPTVIAPIETLGDPKFSADCGEADSFRIKSVDADAFIDFACSIKIDPGKGNTVNLKAVRTNSELPQGWNLVQSFDGDRATSGSVSGPYEFGMSSAGLQIKITPTVKGFVNIEMRIEDADNPDNAVVIPFIAVRTK